MINAEGIFLRKTTRVGVVVDKRVRRKRAAGRSFFHAVQLEPVIVEGICTTGITGIKIRIIEIMFMLVSQGTRRIHGIEHDRIQLIATRQVAPFVVRQKLQLPIGKTDALQGLVYIFWRRLAAVMKALRCRAGIVLSFKDIRCGAGIGTACHIIEFHAILLLRNDF